MDNSFSALIVVDMQEDYIGEKSKFNYYPLKLIDAVNERISDAVKKGEVVIYVRNKGRRKGQAFISPFTAHLSVVSEYIIDKEGSSAFCNVQLMNMLKEINIRYIEIIGIDGNCCVASSALGASKAGFSVSLPIRYIGIKNMERFIKTKERLYKANVKIIE